MIPWLRQLDPDPVVEIHPDTASAHSVGNGEWVWVENWLGRAKLKAKVTPVVPRWTVMPPMAGGSRKRRARSRPFMGRGESNINLLLPMGHRGKDGLGAPIKHSLCRIYKVSGERGQAGE